MTIVVNGSGTITGISQGGLNDNIITQAELATTGVAGNGPTFAAWQSVSQNLTSGVSTKIQFQSEEWDTANCYDNATNYRFTPNVAGYYHITASVRIAAASGTGEVAIFIYKNGSSWKRAADQSGTQFAASFYTMSVNAYVYCNGSTDYIEIYAQQGSGSTVATQTTQDITWFQGTLVRAA